MITKRILVSDRLRWPLAIGWFWTDGRFVREHMDHLSREAVLLYFFLSAVADVNGLASTVTAPWPLGCGCPCRICSKPATNCWPTT